MTLILDPSTGGPCLSALAHQAHGTCTAAVQAQKAVKTAGLQTEVHAGFSVLQTDSTLETLRLYRDLTSALQVLCPLSLPKLRVAAGLP